MIRLDYCRDLLKANKHCIYPEDQVTNRCWSSKPLGQIASFLKQPILIGHRLTSWHYQSKTLCRAVHKGAFLSDIWFDDNLKVTKSRKQIKASSIPQKMNETHSG